MAAGVAEFAHGLAVIQAGINHIWAFAFPMFLGKVHLTSCVANDMLKESLGLGQLLHLKKFSEDGLEKCKGRTFPFGIGCCLFVGGVMGVDIPDFRQVAQLLARIQQWWRHEQNQWIRLAGTEIIIGSCRAQVRRHQNQQRQANG